MVDFWKIFGLTGAIFLLLSLIYNLKLFPKMPHIPGDIWLNKPGFPLYIPWLSTIILSVIITLFMNFFR